ncbi:MAG TPA: ABC transporter permease [Solirubrobacteraceae bacterium]|jgi:ABC-type dipeptide/oligopeptide/nickel transport system permease component|nr:ABC transporter permease [Solirubrobacteraceae bacterium]
MTRFGLLVASRIGEALAVLLAVLALVFLLIAAAPGDAATSIAQSRFGPKVTAGKVEQVRHELGLDGSLTERYRRQLRGWLHGDLGTSVRTRQPVAGEIAERIGATARLAFAAALIALAGGIGGGVLAVLWRRLPRGVIHAVALLGLSIPSFALAYLLVLVFGLRLGWLPTQGEAGLETYIMPALVLGLPIAGALSRVLASTLEGVLDEPYVTTAHARGASRRRAIVVHALPNTAVTILAIASTHLGTLLGGTLVAETLFSWPGIGNYFVRAVAFRDLPAIQAVVIVAAAGVLITRAVAAVASGALDPRTRTLAAW